MDNIYNKQSLSLLNIRDLRDMGRSLGVPSPTTKSKEELIDFILKIIYGEIESPARTNRGRPNTRQFNMEKYVAEIEKRTIMTPSMLEKASEDFNFSLKLASPKNVSEAQIKQSVFVEEDDGAYLRKHAFVKSEDDIEVSKEIQNKYGLENFDVVEFYEHLEMFKIVSINGKKVDGKLDRFSAMGHEFVCGGTQVFHLSTKEEITNQIRQISDDCNKKGISTIILSANSCKYDDAIHIYFDENDGPSQIYKTVMQFVSKAEEFMYQNESVVAIIDDIEKIEAAIKTFDEEVKERIKKHLQGKKEQFAKLGNVLLVFRVETPVIY